MGNWLARLKNQNTPDTYATKATKTPQGEGKGVFVGFVAYSRGPIEKSEATDTAANDAPVVGDPDRYCWPHSDAMNGREVDTFTARLARFTDRGLSLADAERLTDRLVIRDREGDDRRLCLECAHLQGVGPWRCGNWQAADVARQGLARELVPMLQRCPGFRGSTP